MAVLYEVLAGSAPHSEDPEKQPRALAPQTA
jgi:hypothetical protein